MELDLLDLNFSYPRISENAEAPFSLRNICLNLKSGRITLLAGLPSSGKSTLCRILQGIIPSLSGGDFSASLCLDGRDIIPLSAGERIEYIYSAVQNPEEQIICNRCDEEAVFALESLGISRDEAEKRLDMAFSVTGIGHLRARQPASLSGGEKKKLLIASVLALDPEVCLLDEALEEIAEDFRVRILAWLNDRKKTVLLTSSRLHPEYLPFCNDFAVLSENGLEQASVIQHLMPQMRASGLVLDELTATTVPLPPPGESILETGNIRFAYTGNREFQLEIGLFRIRKGECVAFTGDNGSGKSTFARILCGLLKPQTGYCHIGGKDTAFPALNKCCGYIFQNPDHQLFLASIADELRAAGTATEDIAGTCRLFGLPDAGIPSAILSYGMRKKVQAAVFYNLDRKVIILDEADSGLSPREILNIIRLFNKKGRAVILITHDSGLAALIAHRQLLFSNGTIRDAG